VSCSQTACRPFLIAAVLVEKYPSTIAFRALGIQVAYFGDPQGLFVLNPCVNEPISLLFDFLEAKPDSELCPGFVTPNHATPLLLTIRCD